MFACVAPQVPTRHRRQQFPSLALIAMILMSTAAVGCTALPVTLDTPHADSTTTATTTAPLTANVVATPTSAPTAFNAHTAATYASTTPVAHDPVWAKQYVRDAIVRATALTGAAAVCGGAASTSSDPMFGQGEQYYDTHCSIVRLGPDTMANITVLPSACMLVSVDSYGGQSVQAVGAAGATTHIGTARFACLDRYGLMRTFDVPNCHVVPTCTDVLLGNFAADSGTYFVLDGDDQPHLRLPCGARVPVQLCGDGLFGVDAVPVASGSQCIGTSPLACAYNTRTNSDDHDPTCMSEMFGGIGAATMACEGILKPVAYFDSDNDACETYNQHSPQVPQHSTMRAAIVDSNNPESFVSYASKAAIAFSGAPCTAITRLNTGRDERGPTARLLVDQWNIIDRTRQPMCFFETLHEALTADGGRLYADFTQKCHDCGYTCSIINMNPIDYGGVENRPRIYLSCVRSDYYDRLGPFTPPQRTPTVNPSMESVMLPTDSPLIPALRDQRSFSVARLPHEHDAGYRGAHAELWCAQDKCWAYNSKGPCGTMTRTPPCCFDSRPGVNCPRSLHECEVQGIVGLPPDFEFAPWITHASRLKLMGQVMHGACVRALATAATEYLNRTPTTPTACSTAWQQHCQYNHTGKEYTRLLGLQQLREDCHICIANKTKRADVSKVRIPSAEVPLQRVHFDLKISAVASKAGNTCVAGWFDSATNRSWVKPLPCHDSPTLIKAMQDWFVQDIGSAEVGEFWCDNDPSFDESFYDWIRERGWQVKQSASHHQHQNAPAEAGWNVLNPLTSINITSAPHLGYEYWDKAMVHANAARQYWPCKANAQNVSPMTAWNGTPTTPTHLQPFGAVGYVYDEVLGLRPHGTKVYLVGYSPRHALGTYDLYDPAMRSIRPASANVTFVVPKHATSDATNAPDSVLLADLPAGDQPSRLELMFPEEVASRRISNNTNNNGAASMHQETCSVDWTGDDNNDVGSDNTSSSGGGSSSNSSGNNVSWADDIASYSDAHSNPTHLHSSATNHAAQCWEPSNGKFPPDDYVLMRKPITRRIKPEQHKRVDALHMRTMGAAYRTYVDGKQLTRADLDYTINKRKYMYACKPSVAAAMTAKHATHTPVPKHTVVEPRLPPSAHTPPWAWTFDNSRAPTAHSASAHYDPSANLPESFKTTYNTGTPQPRYSYFDDETSNYILEHCTRDPTSSEPAADFMIEFENEDTGKVTPIHCRMTPDREPNAVKAQAYTSKADFMNGTPASFVSTKQLGQFCQDLPQGLQESCFAAVAKEYNTLDRRAVYSTVAPPPGATVHQLLLILRLKFKPSGEHDKTKARAVIMGNGMSFPRDHGPIHAPTARDSTVRLEMCRALHNNYHCTSFDISVAFTFGTPDRHTYVKFGPGLKREYGNDREELAKYLNFNLYGSPSGPRRWSVRMHNKMLSAGFNQSEADPCLYIRGLLHVSIFVDDCLCTFPKDSVSVRDYKTFIEDIRTEFELPEDEDGMTQVESFCGAHVEWAPLVNGSRAWFKISCPRAVDNVLRLFNLNDGCRETSSTPAPPKTLVNLNDCPADGPSGDKDRKFMADKNFSAGVGGMAWIARVHRPDLAHAVSSLARVTHNPGPAHWHRLQHCARYLASTRNDSLVYHRHPQAETTPVVLRGFTDSDFSPDYGNYADNYRSTSGHHYDYNNTPVHWTSHRQSLFAQSAYEAETYAAVDAAKEAIHLNKLLDSMGEHSDEPIHLYGDNKPSTINMQNFADTSRSKALDRQAHYLRYLVHSNQINYSYVAGTDNRADALTKSLPFPAQQRARSHWCVTST
jgi:site-specific DNA-cytosine methylase